MLVYMLLNTVTEMVYVGATDKTLDARWKRHIKDSRSGTSRLQQALRDWHPDMWLPVTLVNCYDLNELSAAETAWITLTDARNINIGYNDNRTTYATSAKNGTLGGDPTKVLGAGSKLAAMSETERREFFRRCGQAPFPAGNIFIVWSPP